MYNVGVIGMGVGEKHALAYQNHPQCELKSFCDFDSEKLEVLKNIFPDQEIFDDAQSIINDKNIDIVSIASYDNYHAQQITQAIENKKHVMAEKPLCLSKSEMEHIRIVLQKNPNVCLSSNLVLRANSRFKRFQNDIAEKNLGDIYYLEADYYWGRKNKLYGWRAEMEFYSIIYGAAVHMVDLVIWLMDAKPISVQAMGNDIATRNSLLKYNSFAVLILRFDNGIIAKITGNGGCVHPHFHGLKIFGTEYTAVHNLCGAYYLYSSDPDAAPIVLSEPYPEKAAREKIIHSFVDYIADQSKTPLVPQKDVFDVMSVCFAAQEAIKSGKEIKIDYVG